MRNETQQRGAALTPRTSDAIPRRVLLAEDDPEMRSLVKDWLVSGGHAVTTCATAEALTEHLLRESRQEFLGEAHQPFDLIVTDLRMPGQDGLEALESLWALPLPPIILITAFGDGETLERAERLKVAAVLFKPFTYNDLMITADWLSRSDLN